MRDGHLLIIRPAIPADKTIIIENINATCAEDIYLATNAYIPTSSWEAALNGEDTGQFSSLLAVAEANGQVIGHGRAFPAGLGIKDAHVVEIGIALQKDFRLQNIGTQLLDYLINWSKEVGYTKIAACVFASNEIALHVFAKLDFRIEGARKAQYKINEKFIDEILLTKFV